jgi:GNAT superfamily N-acetyltransferase
MLATGPWDDVIVGIGARRSELLLRHLIQLDSSARLLRFGRTVTDADLADYVSKLSFRDQHIIGVVTAGELRGVAQICPMTPESCLGAASSVYQATMSVVPGWQRRGIGSALLLRALAIVRNAGGQSLVVDGLSCAHALRKLSMRFSGDFWFDADDCQAWFHIAPALSPHRQNEFEILAK